MTGVVYILLHRVWDEVVLFVLSLIYWPVDCLCRHLPRFIACGDGWITMPCETSVKSPLLTPTHLYPDGSPGKSFVQYRELARGFKPATPSKRPSVADKSPAKPVASSSSASSSAGGSKPGNKQPPSQANEVTIVDLWLYWLMLAIVQCWLVRMSVIVLESEADSCWQVTSIGTTKIVSRSGVYVWRAIDDVRDIY